MSPEPFDSRAEAPPAKRWEKGYGDENGAHPIDASRAKQFRAQSFTGSTVYGAGENLGLVDCKTEVKKKHVVPCAF